MINNHFVREMRHKDKVYFKQTRVMYDLWNIKPMHVFREFV